MSAIDNTPQPPADQGTPPDRDQAGADNAGHDRLWNSPVGIGPTEPLDPDNVEPPLTDEEMDEILKKAK
jgi:hypothetical protein